VSAPVGNEIEGSVIHLSADLVTTTTPVSVIRVDEATASIDASLDTWIVIHGRGNNSSTDYILQLTGTLSSLLPESQVLALDWQEGAFATPRLPDFTGEVWIAPVAQWACSVLSDYGFEASAVNLIGHSWGAVLASELCRSAFLTRTCSTKWGHHLEEK